MNQSITSQIGDIIREHQTFLVAGHIRPDGDVLACQIALGLTLRTLGKTVEVWNPDGISHKYSFLPHADLVRRPPSQARAFDAVFAVDTAAHDRIGNIRDRIASQKVLVNVDHHASNTRFGDINWIEPGAAASGELVHRLLRDNHWPITPAIAANLFVAIATDTGSFQYSNTTPQTLRLAAELVEAGANIAELSRHCFQSYPLGRVRLLQLALAGLRLSADNRIASVWLTKEMYRQSGALPEDSEGLIDHIRAIDSVLVAAVFEQDENGIVRISLRSKSNQINVDKIAAKFGGGGHMAAAGARIPGEPAAVETAVLKTIDQAVRSAADSAASPR
ncbi:MAG: bifunctional oligoribonuclease/PAP phosphatase NrnA [Verrucomicrobia bacterium]|nr:bifunctional oligoribonuclease/PAP phosphatase NrnA [Verrucomicrobiota bacterium]